MQRDEARSDINGRPLTDFVGLERSPKAGRDMYICPICGSGHGKHGTGALKIYPDSNRVFCYSGGCFSEKGEDTLGALELIWHCDETEALERAGYTLDKWKPEPTQRKHQEHHENNEHQAKKEEVPADNTLFYRTCHQALKESPEALDYLHKRGISDSSIDRFNLGYCAAWKHSKAGANVPTTKRIIIPRTKATYTARRIDTPENDLEKNYVKQVQGRQKDLFNLEALDGATPIICEGELDAISLYQAGAASVVAVGTITNAGTLLQEAKKHPEGVFILALDNDEPGKEAQRRLADDMKAAGLDFISPGNLYGEAKDGNEAYTKDPDRLKRGIAWIQEKAREVKEGAKETREEDLKKRTGEGMLEDFLLSVTTRRDFEAIPTGISDLDRALQGGFIRKTLVFLGAAPGMGKTALSQWIFENMATAGHDVLYINLEMDRAQLIARSLSRYCWKYQKKDISALEVLRGYAWTEDKREAITEAADRYGREVAPHFIYNPEGVTNSIDAIEDAMKKETARIKAQGKPAPLICIDYLQLIDSGNRDALEGMKEVIFRLKDFAIKNSTVVFVIMANNRQSNRTGTAELESGRDTSTLEYSGDIVLGLSYTAIEDRRKVSYTYEDKNGDLKEGKEECTLEYIRRLKKEAYEAGEDAPGICNEVSLKVLKNRFGEAERRANLIFDGKHATFNLKEYQHQDTSAADSWQEVPNGSPLPWNK